MGGPDADALEWRALLSPRFAPRLRHLGVEPVSVAAEADVVVLTGLLTERNLDAVLHELALVPSPSVLIAAGDAATNNSAWAKLDMPALSTYPLDHYVDVQVSVPGDPPTPQALIAALAAAAEMLSRPGERLPAWQED
jgi:Ni,Fe-hydrogenase III small subunit